MSYMDDDELWDRSRADAFRIVVGGVIAGAVFRLLISLDIPELSLFAGTIITGVAILVVILLIFVLAYFLYQIESAAPETRSTMTDEDIEAISDRVVEKLQILTESDRGNEEE